MIVVDTNIIAYLLIDGPQTESCTRLLHRDNDWRAPWLWRSEFGSVLTQHWRRGFLLADDPEIYMLKALELMRGGEESINPLEALRISAESGHSYYDCEFIALAHKLRVPLITADRRILKTFSQTAVTPHGF